MLRYISDNIKNGVIILVVIALISSCITFLPFLKKYLTYIAAIISAICAVLALSLSLIKNKYEREKESVMRAMSYRVLCYHALDIIFFLLREIP